MCRGARVQQGYTPPGHSVVWGMLPPRTLHRVNHRPHSGSLSPLDVPSRLTGPGILRTYLFMAVSLAHNQASKTHLANDYFE